MALRLHNSLTNQLESFNVNKNETVNIYVCGPTVYNYIHIGNARPIVFFDVLVSYLKYLGYKVNYISNVTDIDDKIIKKAIEENVSEELIASRYLKHYLEDISRLNSKLPDNMPKATDNIYGIISLINDLIDKGFAYNVGGNVYFRVDKIKDYGVLSNQDLEALKTAVRIEENTEKENPYDFTLWKSTKEGITFDSSFGRGRPGWHSECVVMSQKYASHLHIHGGGMDLKFPHHENEIAQAKALHNSNLADFWIHVGRVDLKGEKMSKSLGNSIFVKDFTLHDDLMTLRMILAFSNYRQLIDYSENLFKQYKDIYLKWERSLKQVTYFLDAFEYKSLDIIDDSITSFKSFMDDDFNVQNVLTLLESLFKDLNKEFRNKDTNIRQLLLIYNTIIEILNIFNLNFNLKKLTEDEKMTYRSWFKAKSDKDFELADTYRLYLLEHNIL